MREKVISTRGYRGHSIEHIEVDEFHGARPFRSAGYYKRRFWWVVELGDDFSRLHDAKARIDELGLTLVTDPSHPARFVVCPECGQRTTQWCGKKFELHESRIALARRVPAANPRRLPGSFEAARR